MSQTEIGLIGIVILSVMLMIGLDVGFSMLVTGFIGFALIGGWGAAFGNMAILPFDTLNNYFFAVLPLFLLMGAFCAEGQIGREAYDMARTWFGQFKRWPGDGHDRRLWSVRGHNRYHFGRFAGHGQGGLSGDEKGGV